MRYMYKKNEKIKNNLYILTPYSAHNNIIFNEKYLHECWCYIFNELHDI